MGVWIDTDMGYDDLVAVLVLAHNGLPIDGVSLVFGNAPLQQVCTNAAGARQAFGWSFPIFAGRTAPVLAPPITAQSILGQTGLPTTGLSLPEGAGEPAFGPAFAALCTWLEQCEEPRRVLALGPLTNIAALALARPDLAARIDDLTWMGGGVTSGNHTASAEFNALADPEALAIVLAHGLPLRMVDLDFGRKVLLHPQDVERIRAQGGTQATLLADLSGGFVRIALERGRPAMALYDPAAAVAFLRPDLVTFRPAAIAVELAGQLTRGRTVVETRASHAAFNAAYAADGAYDTVRDVILDALMREAAR